MQKKLRCKCYVFFFLFVVFFSVYTDRKVFCPRSWYQPYQTLPLDSSLQRWDTDQKATMSLFIHWYTTVFNRMQWHNIIKTTESFPNVIFLTRRVTHWGSGWKWSRQHCRHSTIRAGRYSWTVLPLFNGSILSSVLREIVVSVF